MRWFPIFGRRRPKPQRPDIEASAEKTRLVRGQLAVAVYELAAKRQDLEELMTRMLEERRNA